jgi:hypothetical protein
VTASAAPEHLRRRYLRGGCFALAQEMHRLSGLPLFGLRDDEGGLHHAFAADPETGIGWDIRGSMPLDRIPEGSTVPKGVVRPITLEDLEAQVGSFDVEDLQAAAHAIRSWLLPAGFPLVASGVPSLLPDPAAPGPDAARAELYSRGSCHVFALAALDALSDLGRPMGLRVVFDAEGVSWENPEDTDDRIHVVLHVYAVFDVEGRAIAIDVFGARPLEEAEAETSARFGAFDAFSEDHPDFSSMDHLVERCEDVETGVDRPLHGISLQDLAEARRDILEIFALGVPAPILIGEDALEP